VKVLHNKSLVLKGGNRLSIWELETTDERVYYPVTKSESEVDVWNYLIEKYDIESLNWYGYALEIDI
jgi:hypothetical protein